MIGEILGIVEYVDGDLVKIYAAKSRNDDGTYVTSKDYVGNEKYAIWVTYVEDTFSIWFHTIRPGNNEIKVKAWHAYDQEGVKIPLKLTHNDIYDCVPGGSKEVFEKVKESQRLKFGTLDHIAGLHDALEDGIPAGTIHVIKGRQTGKTSMLNQWIKMMSDIQLHDFEKRGK